MKAQILAVQRMQDYIEAHLEQEITLSHLAKESLYSPWYSWRLFQTYTGSTPAEYIRRLLAVKIGPAAQNERCRVIDAALDLGFGSVDGYQRAFTKSSAVIPANMPNILFYHAFSPYGVKFRALRKDVLDMEKIAKRIYSSAAKTRSKSHCETGNPGGGLLCLL